MIAFPPFIFGAVVLYLHAVGGGMARAKSVWIEIKSGIGGADLLHSSTNKSRPGLAVPL